MSSNFNYIWHITIVPNLFWSPIWAIASFNYLGLSCCFEQAPVRTPSQGKDHFLGAFPFGVLHSCSFITLLAGLSVSHMLISLGCWSTRQVACIRFSNSWSEGSQLGYVPWSWEQLVFFSLKNSGSEDADRLLPKPLSIVSLVKFFGWRCGSEPSVQVVTNSFHNFFSISDHWNKEKLFTKNMSVYWLNLSDVFLHLFVFSSQIHVVQFLSSSGKFLIVVLIIFCHRCH